MEPEVQELVKKFSDIISENGLKVSGNGILCEHARKILEKLDKIDTKLYFLEKRDKERTESLNSKKA